MFALHPVCVDSVAWMSEQKNTLSTLFGLAAAWVYLDFDRTRRPARYWLAFLLFAGALLTKSITATLVPALLVVFWWQRGRLDCRRDVRPLVPWVLAGAAQGLFTGWYERGYAHINLGYAFSRVPGHLADPADPRAALRQCEIAVQLRPDWAAARQAVALMRAQLGE